jgi:uncharacterized phage protein (TIGR01671 family)
MQRELQFRFWDDVTKRFYYLYLDEIVGTREMQVPKNPIIQQYTNLLDKDGKQIWEGDILEIPESEVGINCVWKKYCQVWYSRFSGQWVVSYNHMYSEMSDALYKHIMVYVVIGNIFENKELLNATRI